MTTHQHDSSNFVKLLRIVLALALLGLCVAFIWSNSLQSPEASASRSEAIAAFITPILSNIFGPQSSIVSFVYFRIRKIAHALEFAMLGMTSIAMLGILGRIKASTTVYAAFMVLLVAVTDETIQLFTNRGASVADIVLDFAGGIAGILIALIFYGIIRGIVRRIRS